MEMIINAIKNLNEQSAIDLVIAIILLVVLDIFSPLFSYIIIKMFNFKKTKKQIKENTFYLPLKTFFKITGVYGAILFLRPTFNFSSEFMDMVTKIYKIIVIISMAIGIANSITKKSIFIKKVNQRSSKNLDENSIKILIRGIKTIIYIVAVFLIFAELGYDLSGLITGLGLGSIVVSLAAQDTIKNLLGGILIFIDKPFQVGDYIIFGTYEGTVEDMTFRSTRIRTLDNSIVQIPNSLVSSESLENISSISRRRYKLDLQLVLDTKMEEINILKNKIFEALMKNENVFKDTIHIYFNEIDTNGYNLLILCYLNVSEYYEFLELKEEINEDIMTVINKERVQLAYDTKTIEIKR